MDLSQRSETIVEASVPAPRALMAVRLRSRSLFHGARDRLLTVAAVATILAATLGLGPFEARNANGPGTIERVAAIR